MAIESIADQEARFKERRESMALKLEKVAAELRASSRVPTFGTITILFTDTETWHSSRAWDGIDWLKVMGIFEMAKIEASLAVQKRRINGT